MVVGRGAELADLAAIDLVFFCPSCWTSGLLHFDPQQLANILLLENAALRVSVGVHRHAAGSRHDNRLVVSNETPKRKQGRPHRPSRDTLQRADGRGSGRVQSPGEGLPRIVYLAKLYLRAWQPLAR